MMVDILKYENYEGSAEIDLDRGCCRGKILFIKDLVTYEAPDPKALRVAFQEAVDDYLGTCKALGRSPQKPFHGTFNVRVSSDLHRRAAVKATQAGTSLNDVMSKALACYLDVGPTQVSNFITVFGPRSESVTTMVTSFGEPSWEAARVQH